MAIIAVGSMVEETYKAIDMLEKENVHPAFVNPVFIKPDVYKRQVKVWTVVLKIRGMM